MRSPGWLQPQNRESLKGKARHTLNSHPNSMQEAALPTDTPPVLSSEHSCPAASRQPQASCSAWAGLSDQVARPASPVGGLGSSRACSTPACTIHLWFYSGLGAGRGIRITGSLQTFSKAGCSQCSSKLISLLTWGVLFQASVRTEAPGTQGTPWKRLLWKPHTLNTSTDTMVLHSVMNDWFFWALMSEASLSIPIALLSGRGTVSDAGLHTTASHAGILHNRNEL